MDLPKNEAVFDFDYTGATTNKKYDGQFTVVCMLNMARKHALEIEKTRLMADFQNPTDGLFGLAVVLANLRVRIVDAPEWWKQSKGGFDILDEDALVALYDKVMEQESKWRESLKTKAETAVQKTEPAT
jgi:hypothetical protein